MATRPALALLVLGAVTPFLHNHILPEEPVHLCTAVAVQVYQATWPFPVMPTHMVLVGFLAMLYLNNSL